MFDEAPAAEGLQLRIGLDAGTAVSAIVGRTRFHWDLWSDTVNTAARMESHGVPGRIHVTRAFRELLGDDVACEPFQQWLSGAVDARLAGMVGGA